MVAAEAISAVPPAPEHLPPWIRVRAPSGELYSNVRGILRELRLGTVCQEARCPNLPECWSNGHATIMLLGADCSRRCGFCAVSTHWARGDVDHSEPFRVAEAVARWGLKYVVLTQVCRDDLEDGGAAILGETVRQIRLKSPETRVELLIGDLGGSAEALDRVFANPPEVLAHNIETVRSLSSKVRDRRAGYDTSLSVLARARAYGPHGLVTKSSIMLGLGETETELVQAFRDLRSAGVDLLTLGQYLRPSPRHLPVQRFVPPDEFERLKQLGLQEGFAAVSAGPLVRSSYRAHELFAQAIQRSGG